MKLQAAINIANKAIHFIGAMALICLTFIYNIIKAIIIILTGLYNLIYMVCLYSTKALYHVLKYIYSSFIDFFLVAILYIYRYARKALRYVLYNIITVFKIFIAILNFTVESSIRFVSIIFAISLFSINAILHIFILTLHLFLKLYIYTLKIQILFFRKISRYSWQRNVTVGSMVDAIYTNISSVLAKIYRYLSSNISKFFLRVIRVSRYIIITKYKVIKVLYKSLIKYSFKIAKEFFTLLKNIVLASLLLIMEFKKILLDFSIQKLLKKINQTCYIIFTVIKYSFIEAYNLISVVYKNTPQLLNALFKILSELCMLSLKNLKQVKKSYHLLIFAAIALVFIYIYTANDNFKSNSLYNSNYPYSANTTNSIIKILSGIKNQKYYTKIITIEPSDTIYKILEDNSISTKDINNIIEITKPYINIAKIPEGSDIKLSIAIRDGQNYIHKMYIPYGSNKNIVINANDFGDYSVSVQEENLSTYIVKKQLTVHNSIYQDAREQGITDRLISRVINDLSWDVDFQRDVRSGNKLSALFLCNYNQYSELVNCPDILYIKLSLSNRVVEMYKYQGEYYTKDGKKAESTLLKTLVKGARLSSTFGLRKHPVLGYSRLHKGIDFAAPVGSEIVAAGDGIIKSAYLSKSYGNNVIIKHNNNVTTLYAHMIRFAKGIKRGMHIKQGDVIGYLGSTGIATGPHLHYEVRINNKHVNPLTVKIPRPSVLQGAELRLLYKHQSDLNELYLRIKSNNRIGVNVNDKVISTTINKPKEEEESEQ